VKNGLAILLAAKAKPKGEAKAAKAEKKSTSMEAEYAELAVEALLDKDAKGAAKALKRLVEACVRAAEGGEYEDEDED